MENKNQKQLLTRRTFLNRTAVAAGAASLSFPFIGRVLGANDRINVACVGVGGKGDSASTNVFSIGGNIVGLCDIDSNTLNGKDKSFKGRAEKENRTYDAKLFRD